MIKKSFLIIAAVAVLISICGTREKEQSPSKLEDGFMNPPAESRPHTFWIWMNGNITREGITADLEAMARVGIGGVMLFNVGGSHGTDIPAGPVDYMSEEWLGLLKYTAMEAERLGLEISLKNCAGWATTGGPWVTPEYGMMQLVTAELTLWGNRRIIQKLPHPEVFEGYYRDIAVYAFPNDFDKGYRVNEWEQKAGQRGGRAGRQPDLSPVPEGSAIAADAIIEISRFVNEKGVLEWDVPPGVWKILRIGYTPTGKTNQPAPESGQGLEIDKLRRDGLDLHWREGIQPVLDHLGPLAGKALNTIHLDSYEAGLHHWTPRMKQEFEKRRGYDPVPFLLALTGRLIKDPATTERFLWDFRRTISDLFAENYYGYFADLCHETGLQFLTEPYTSCFEGLAVAAKTDFPTGEFWVDGGYSFSLRLAASLAHINGRKFASAEAFTAPPHLARWENHPGSLKRVGDWAWTQGINRFILHSYPHQPWTDVVPGMTMGQYGCHFDRNNTWWEPGRAWIQYITRSQFLLQSGENVADILIFAGDAAPNGGINQPEIKAAGYDYDAFGTDMLLKLEVKDGDIVLPSGKRYRLLVLPETEFMRPVFARKIRDLVRSGATILGPKPKHTPSLEGFPDTEKEVIAIGEEVWGRCDGVNLNSARYGEGQVFYGISPAEVLSQINVAPDVQLADSLAWIHRRTDDADIFFISNQSGKNIYSFTRFRTVGKMPEFWDAVNGKISIAPGWTVDGEYSEVPVKFNPDESVFVVFRKPGTPEADPYIRVNGPNQKDAENLLPAGWLPGFVADRELQVRAWDNGSYTLHKASGITKNIEVVNIPEPIKLPGPWEVRFQKGRGAPAGAQFDSLMSWDSHPEPGIRYFSGTAKYFHRFDIPAGYLSGNQEVWLDLGDVAVIAEVRVNGRQPVILWNNPFLMEVSKFLRSGPNFLEVDVTNLWVNRLIGDEQYSDDCDWSQGNYLNSWPDWFINGQQRPVPSRVTFTTWKHWKQNNQLMPSGLIGPVKLRFATLVEVN